MSGIPKSERTQTKVSHYIKAKQLRMRIIAYLEQDFAPDKAHHDDGAPNERYWLIQKFRNTMYDLAQDMMRCVTAANTIHIYHVYEYNERRRYFTQAISDCESLLQETQMIIDYLHMKPEKYANFAEDIADCIKSIKGRRQADNPIRVQVLERDEKEKLKIAEKIKG